MQLSESKTLENLKTAFANESAAMVRYEIFAEKAKQSGSPFPADGLPLYCRLFYFRMVFLPCGCAAAQMTLLFIHAQHLLHLVVQSVILLFQTVCNILVHCRFADAERFGRAAHGGAGLRDVFAQLHRPLLRIALHAATTPYLCLLHIYGGFGRFMRTKRRERPAYSKM